MRQGGAANLSAQSQGHDAGESCLSLRPRKSPPEQGRRLISRSFLRPVHAIHTCLRPSVRPGIAERLTPQAAGTDTPPFPCTALDSRNGSPRFCTEGAGLALGRVGWSSDGRLSGGEAWSSGEAGKPRAGGGGCRREGGRAAPWRVFTKPLQRLERTEVAQTKAPRLCSKRNGP